MRSGLNTVTRIASIAVLGMVAGALASLAAIAFVELVAVLNRWLLISPRSRFMVDDAQLLLLATICVPAVGGLIVGVVHRFIPERRPHGPPTSSAPSRGWTAGSLRVPDSCPRWRVWCLSGPVHRSGSTGRSPTSERPSAPWSHASTGTAGGWRRWGWGAASRRRSRPRSTLLSRGSSSRMKSSSGTTPCARSHRSRSPRRSVTSSPMSSSNGPRCSGGSRHLELRAGVSGVHPHRGRRRLRRRAVHARHPLLEPDRPNAARCGLPQADAGGSRSWGWPRSGCPTSSASARRRCASPSSTTRSHPAS